MLKIFISKVSVAEKKAYFYTIMFIIAYKNKTKKIVFKKTLLFALFGSKLNLDYVINTNCQNFHSFFFVNGTFKRRYKLQSEVKNFPSNIFFFFRSNAYHEIFIIKLYNFFVQKTFLVPKLLSCNQGCHQFCLSFKPIKGIFGTRTFDWKNVCHTFIFYENCMNNIFSRDSIYNFFCMEFIFMDLAPGD